MPRILPQLFCFAFTFGSLVQCASADCLASFGAVDGGTNASRFIAFDEGGYDKQGEGYGSCSGTHNSYGETYGRYNEPLGPSSSTSGFGRYGGSSNTIHQRYGSYYGRYNEPVGQTGTSTFGGWGSGRSATDNASGSRLLRAYMVGRAFENREGAAGQNGNQPNIESQKYAPTHVNIETPNGMQTYNTTSSTLAAEQLGSEVSHDFSAILQSASSSIQNGGMRFLNGNNAPSPYAGTRYVAPIGAESLPYHSQGLIPEFTTYANRE